MFVSNIYPVFRITDQETLPNYYLQRLLKTSIYKVIINDYCLGGARADLKIDYLSRIKLELPTEETIKRTVNLSDKLDEAYNNYMALLRLLMKN